ncbi:proliferating cell nuclear antigen (pcna) [Candidatus Marsarchaeota archaeon]|nr:proliferating cell nuclear antigen (pcna) [Candidatus Marsarchaeota archaeon]
MFEIKIDDAKYWKNCIDSIANVVDEGVFEIAKEGITLKAIDPSGISMICFSIPNKAFSKYELDKSVSIGLDISNLIKILSTSRQNEQVIMKSSSNKFNIEFIGEHSSRRYKLPIIEVKNNDIKEPKIADPESVVEVKADTLKEILKDANSLSSYVGFKTTKNSFMVVAKSDIGELEEEHLDNAEFIKKLDVSKPTSVSFNIDYLQRIISASPQGSVIALLMRIEDPIKINYTIGEAEVRYYLAPYIEN